MKTKTKHQTAPKPFAIAPADVELPAGVLPDGSNDLDTPPGAPLPSKVEAEPSAKADKYGWLRRLNAQRAIQSAIRSLTAHDFLAFGVDVAPALDVLKGAAEKFPASKPTAKIEAGSVVRLKAKAAPKFDGIFETTDSIEVVAVSKAGIKGKLADGTVLLLPRASVELVAS